MKKAEKIVLSVGLLLWFGGDLITTYIGLNMGIKEANLPTQDFHIILLMKLIAAGFVVLCLLALDRFKFMKLKIIPYVSMYFVGLIVTITNYMRITGAI